MLGRRRPAHPVVVACLLQGGAEEEAAAGDACVSGTLDVPVGAGEMGRLAKGPGPTLQRLPLGPRYLARLWMSGFVLSITTRFLCFRATSHVVTQRCHEPRVSWGTQKEARDGGQETQGDREPERKTQRQRIRDPG